MHRRHDFSGQNETPKLQQLRHGRSWKQKPSAMTTYKSSWILQSQNSVQKHVHNIYETRSHDEWCLLQRYNIVVFKRAKCNPSDGSAKSMLDLLVLRSLCPCVGAVQASTSWIYGTIWSRNPWELLCHAKPFQNKWMRRCKLWQGEKSITANVLWLWVKKTEMPFMWTLFEAEHVWRKSGNPDVPKPGKCCLHLAADWIQHIGTSFFCSSSDHQLLSAQHISTHWALIVASDTLSWLVSGTIWNLWAFACFFRLRKPPFWKLLMS